MDRRLLSALIAAGVAGGIAVYLWARDSAPDAGASAIADDPYDAAPRPASSDSPPVAPTPAAFASVAADDDPMGPLRLEGIVLDADEQPVAGASVFIDSRPTRSETSGEDGTFAFDNLPGRSYRVSVRSGDAIGGPIVHRLTDTSDPVVVRVHDGAKLEVTVVAASTGEPIAGAAVQLRGHADDHATANSDGIASFSAVHAGGNVLVATAPGYARASTFVQVPESSTVALRERLALEAGAAVTGRVVDPEGRPVAGARVIARDAGEVFGSMDPKRDGVLTDDDGAFRIPAIGAGTYRFVAFHTQHPPSSTDPLELDGTSERSDVVIVMEVGGILAGRAIDGAGAPVPWATIRVGPDVRELGMKTPRGEGSRSAVADEGGTFRIEGLPRDQLIASASSDAASSELASVDLRQSRERTGLVLTLDVDGAIAGVVVDDAGEPIAEAQVLAYADVFQGESLTDLLHRGPQFATTDGGGRFRIGGLRAGAYRVRASRQSLTPNDGLNGGTRAKVGDSDVRVVLPAPGGVAGRAVFSNGEAPELVTVSVGATAGVPADGGRFKVEDIPPGTYEVVLRGPEFPDHIERNVAIEAGAIADLGTIELHKGRAVVGRVIDSAGRGVGGATVVAGRQLIGDGKNLAADLGTQLDDQFGIRRATTQADGTFRISGLGERELAIAAEHADRGRSQTRAVPAGTDDVRLELSLAPLGRIRGSVTLDGEAASGARVMVSSAGSARASINAQAGADGSFAIDRLAAGTYKVTAMVGAGMASTMTSRRVEVPGGTTAEVALDMVTGDISLAVEVAGKQGATIDAAQVFLFEGLVEVENAGELMKVFSASADTGAAKMAFAWPPKPAEFAKLVPAAYSACIIPITGDMSDQGFVARLQRHVEALSVYCDRIEIGATPTEQKHRAVVPAMDPLPE